MPQSIEHTTYTRQHTHTHNPLLSHKFKEKLCGQTDWRFSVDEFNTVLLYGLIVRIILYEAKYWLFSWTSDDISFVSIIRILWNWHIMNDVNIAKGFI